MQTLENVLNIQVMMMQQAAELIWANTCPYKRKICNCILWSRHIPRDLYILLSNLLGLLFNSSSCYTTGLFPASSYYFCLLSIVFCSLVTCLLSAFKSILTYVSPLMTSSALQPHSSSSQGCGNGRGYHLRQYFTVKLTAVMTSQVLVMCQAFKV